MTDEARPGIITAAQVRGMADKPATPPVIRTITLDAARDRALLNYRGNYISIRNADSINTEILVYFDRPEGEPVPLRRGQGFRHFPFSRVFITNAASPGAWVEVVIAGEPQEARHELFEVLIPPASQDVTIAGQSATLEVDNPSGDSLDVNIESQSVTLDVNIAAQSECVQIEPCQGVPGTDFTWVSAYEESAGAPTGNAIYTVPASKKLVIVKAIVWRNSTTVNKAVIKNASAAIVAEMYGGNSAMVEGFQGLVMPAGYTFHGVGITAGGSSSFTSIEGRLYDV